MRISVCEFLRLSTSKNWFYKEPGHWVSDGLKYAAKRDTRYGADSHEFKLYRNGRYWKSIRYFEGISSHEVRKNNRKR